jgi:hypothetical protein
MPITPKTGSLFHADPHLANLGRNLMEGRLGILTAVFEAAPVNT